MKELKKLFCLLLTLVMAATALPVCMATAAGTRLQFDENGEFTILHLTDWHCDYPLPETHKTLVLESIAAVQPDLAVLGGDLSEAAHEDQPAAIKEICEIFVEKALPFVITFGNHDYMHGYTIDEMFAFYREYGGEYFIGVDEDPALFGCGTCSLPVYAHNEDRVAYNVYCFDSGDRVEDKGYDSVHADQVEWYKNKAEALKAENGGEYVPAVVFQHIIVQEIYDKLFPEASAYDKIGLREYDGITYQLKAIPNLSNIADGYIFEKPCPGYYNYGQLDAMSEHGDVRAIFCGHDHYNSFTVNIDGVDIVNTPSIKPHILLRKINWGPCVIRLYENGDYESRVLTACALAEQEGSQLIACGAVPKIELFIVKIWKVFADFSLLFWNAVTKQVYKF